MKYTYLLIDLACLSVPLLASFHPKFPFYKSWRSFIKANLIVAFVFVVWDSWFVSLGVWGFNSNYLTGVQLFNLPLEEILFFICIPYCCVFSFYALNRLIRSNPLAKLAPFITLGLIIPLLVVGLLYLDRAYTALTFITTALFLGYLWFKKVKLHFYYLTYLFIFPFFLISNGLLTGTKLAEPVVWYANSENLALRFGTIPIEDFVYGLLLIFGTIYLFERFEKIRTGSLTIVKSEEQRAKRN